MRGEGGVRGEGCTSAVSISISTDTGWPGSGSLPSRDRFSSLETCLSSGIDRLNLFGESYV